MGYSVARREECTGQFNGNDGMMYVHILHNHVAGNADVLEHSRVTTLPDALGNGGSFAFE